MKIEIYLTKKDMEELIAEHCRKQFKVDPKNVEILLSPFEGKYVGKVEGEYRPE